MRSPHRFSTIDDYAKLWCDNAPTPEAFTENPRAYRRFVALEYCQAFRRSQREAKKLRRAHSLDIAGPIGTDHAVLVVFSALLEQLKAVAELQRSTFAMSEFYNRKAAQALALGDLAKAAEHDEQCRAALARYDALEAEWQQLDTEAHSLLARIPSPNVTALRVAILEALEAAENIPATWKAAADIEPRTRPPRTETTFAHAPPALSMSRARTRRGKSRALNRS
jgi:hypothetical protein